MEYRQTSREAWDSFRPDPSAKLDDQILRALFWRPQTCQQIETLIGRDHQSVSGNLRHLVEAGQVRASGRRDKTRSGRSAIIWEIVPGGQATVPAPARILEGAQP